jgi:ABC-type multidrug transport system ATPase subunit
MAMIQARGVTRKFDKVTALRGIDLDVARGEMFALIGPDGAGKTTFFRIVAGLLKPTTGTLEREPNLTFGLVPQRFGLYQDMSIDENLTFRGDLYSVPRDTAKKRATELLDLVGLGKFRDRLAGALSGGMKQKLAIANALLPNPALMVLDEPTAGVDVVARGEIWAMLAERRHETLVVISTSYLDEAAASDRLVYLDAGRVVATGTPDALRAAVPLSLYRAWGDDARAIAAAARALPWVHGARAMGRFARVEVRRDGAPAERDVVRALSSLPGHAVRLAEPVPLDMESTLLGLSQGLAR